MFVKIKTLEGKNIKFHDETLPHTATHTPVISQFLILYKLYLTKAFVEQSY
jgi:hypothetical protein